ncbi:uncharacterized protein LOC143368206 isoform X2 [Andrena cerasifolii]
MCCVTLLNRKPKEALNQLTESATSVRGKRSGRHCLFRHCTGIVCADKLMKRRRNKLHRVHLRISQDIVSDYWKVCKDNGNVTSGDIIGDDAQTCGEILSNTAENVHATRGHGGETVNEYCNASSANVKSVEEEANADIPPMDIKYAEEKTAPKIDDEVESFSDWNVWKMCAPVSTAQPSPRIVTEANIFGDICDNDSPKGIAKDVTDAQRNKIPFDETCIKDVDTDTQKYPSGTIKRHSQSNSSFSDTIVKGHCVDSALYRELRTKCTPATEKRLPADHAKVGRSAEISSVKSPREFDSNLKHSVNRLRSTSKVQKRVHREVDIESTFPAAWQKGTTNRKKLSKFPCENYFCDTRTCRNSSPWNSARKDYPLKFNPCFVQPQCRIPVTSSRSKKNTCARDSVRSRKSIDSALDRKLTSACETRCAKYKPRLAQCKEKPTLVIYKNKMCNKAREELRCENSTHSAYSSTTSTEFTESSVGGNRVACRCPSYRSSYCTMTPTNRYKHSRYNTRVSRNSLLSSSSLSSFNRHHHWMLSQDCLYQKRKPISSVYTNVQACMKRCSRNKKRTSTYPSSTSSSSSSSLMSLSTFKEDLEITNTDQTIYHASTRDDRLFSEEAGSFEESYKYQRLWKRPNYREQANTRTVYTDERHVTWDIKQPR